MSRVYRKHLIVFTNLRLGLLVSFTDTLGNKKILETYAVKKADAYYVLSKYVPGC